MKPQTLSHILLKGLGAMKNDNYEVIALLCIYTLVFGIICIALSLQLMKTKDALISARKQLAVVAENLDLETRKSNELASELDATTKSLDEANRMISALKNTEYELIYIGEFKLTHYCTETYKHICGTGDGTTSTGTQVTAGRTIAVDPKVIPYNTHVYIEGYGWRVAEDTGGIIKDKHIDIAVETHSMALSLGVASGGVWILVEKGY